MRILFLHEVNYRLKPIFEMHEFPEGLAARQHKVAFMEYPEGDKVRSSWVGLFEKTINGRFLPETDITLFTPAILANGVLGRLFHVFTFSFAFAKALKRFKPDIVVSFSVATSGWQSLLVSRRAGIPFMFRGLDVSHLIRRSVFWRAIRKAERFIYRNANWVSVNNPSLLRYVIENGADEKRASVELPTLDVSHFTSVSSSSATRKDLGIPLNSRVIVYMGSFFYFSGLPAVVRDFAHFSGADDRLLLIGGGEQEVELRELVDSLNIQTKVIFTGFVAFDDLPGFLKLGDVAINPMERHAVSNYALPNKVIQYLAAGIPTVSTRLSGLQETLSDAQSLVIVETPEDVCLTALNLARRIPDPNSILKSQDAVIRMFASDVTVRKFEQRVAGIAGGLDGSRVPTRGIGNAWQCSCEASQRRWAQRQSQF